MMSEDEENKVKADELEEGVTLREHVYDGIQEFDQRLPDWWLWTFYIAIIFFLGYWLLYFNLKAMPSDTERLEARLVMIDEARRRSLMTMVNDEGLWGMSQDTAVTSEGEKIYQTRCMACHGMKLGGRSEGPQYVGEPLSDKTWKYGAMPTQIFKVVHDGSPDVTKGMPPWGPVLGPDRVVQVVAFVLSHHQPDDQGAAGESAVPPAADADQSPAGGAAGDSAPVKKAGS